MPPKKLGMGSSVRLVMSRIKADVVHKSRCLLGGSTSSNSSCISLALASYFTDTYITMHLFSIFAAVVTLAGTRSLAQNTSPDCISTCADQFPTSSQCDGDETGTARSTCMCNTLMGSPLLQCWTDQCSDADKAAYAQSIEPPCRDQLFTGLNVDALAPASTASDTATTTRGTGIASIPPIPTFTVPSGPLDTETPSVTFGSATTYTNRAGGPDATDTAGNGAGASQNVPIFMAIGLCMLAAA